jgi:hypothetical protein
MTAATFDPNDCGPIPAGFDIFVVAPGPDVDVTSLVGGPLIGVAAWTPLGGGRFLISDLPFGTYQIGPGNNYSGPLFLAPGYGAPVSASGPGASTFAVPIDAGNPDVVVTFYRLGQGMPQL